MSSLNEDPEFPFYRGVPPRCVIRPLLAPFDAVAGPSLHAAIKALENRHLATYKTEPKMNLNIKSNIKPAPRFNEIAVSTLFVMGDAVWIKTGEDNALKVGSMDHRSIGIDPNAKVRRIKDLTVLLDD